MTLNRYSSATMGVRLARGTPPGYARWQRLLAAYFWGNLTRPVVMFVDDDELGKIAPAEAQPAQSLARAVWETVPAKPGRFMFEGVTAWQELWSGGDRAQPPPTLPVLALSVLAASRMHRDSDAPSHNYYLRLAQVMLPERGLAQVEELRLALREQEAFLPVVGMWQELDTWVCERGGVSTIRSHLDWTRIGYPLSQALVRQADRAVLTQFFAALDLGPGRPRLDGASLLRFLRLWARHPRGLSEALEVALESADEAELLSLLLSALADSWDGTVVTPEGLPRLAIRLVLDLDCWHAGWAVQVADGVDGDVLFGQVAGRACEVAITRDGSRPNYSVRCEPPVSPEAARDGFRLVGGQSVAEFPRHGVIVLAEDPDAGAWASVPTVTAYCEHILAAPPTLASQVRQFLEQAADPGWRVVRQGTTALLAGWTLFERVVLSDERACQAALALAPLVRAAGLGPEPTARPRLVGGLPLARAVSGSAFLVGGAPDLLLPAADEPRHVPATLDGVDQTPPFLAAGFPVELRRLSGLAAGTHEVTADGQRLPFTLLEASPTGCLPPGTGSIGWDRAGEVGGASDGHRLVVGALVEAADSTEPLLCRRGKDETWLLLRNGRCMPVLEPAVPALHAQLPPDLTPTYFECATTPEVAWVAQRRGDRWQVQRVNAQGPGFGALDHQSRQLWRRLAGNGPLADALWRSYQTSWESVHGC